MKRKLDDNDKETSNENNYKKKRKINYLRNEFNKNTKNIKKIFSNKKENYEDKLLRIFSNLENIEDIIKLKDHPEKFYFLNDKKFLKIYNLIPCLIELKISLVWKM